MKPIDWSKYESNKLEVSIMGTKFNWGIWAKKLGWNALFALITGLIVIWQDDARFIALLPILKAAENYIKHNYLTK